MLDVVDAGASASCEVLYGMLVLVVWEHGRRGVVEQVQRGQRGAWRRTACCNDCVGGAAGTEFVWGHRVLSTAYLAVPMVHSGGLSRLGGHC